MGTEEKPGPRSIRDEILAILNMVDKYGYCLNSELDEYADKIIEIPSSPNLKNKIEITATDLMGCYLKSETAFEVKKAFISGTEFVLSDCTTKLRLVLITIEQLVRSGCATENELKMLWNNVSDIITDIET